MMIPSSRIWLSRDKRLPLGTWNQSSSSTSVSQEKRYYGNQDPWKSVVGEDRLGNLVRKQIYSKASLQQIIQNWMTTVHDLLKSGKVRIRRTIDQVNLLKLLGVIQQVRLDHEEILLDGTAHSVRYGEPLRDRSGQLDNINSQEVANSQNSSWEEIQQNYNCL